MKTILAIAAVAVLGACAHFDDSNYYYTARSWPYNDRSQHAMYYKSECQRREPNNVARCMYRNGFERVYIGPR